MPKTEKCPWCDGDALEGTTCPKSIKCPRCKAGAGERCKRPSGHVATELHAERIEMAEGFDLPAADASRWTIHGAHHGTVYATDVSMDVALEHLEPYHASRADLELITIGDAYRTHPDARGLVAFRIS